MSASPSFSDENPELDGRRTERTLLIDADDTLWENNIFYLRCTARFAERMVALGFDARHAVQTLELTERDTVSQLGYGPEGFIEALALACERLLASENRAMEDELGEAIRTIGALVRTPPCILLADVEETLTTLRATSRLVLVTKGDDATQRAKLARSGLEPLFDAVYVVAEKDPDVYREIAGELGCEPGHTWMVGNSPRSDINPAIEAGLGAILVPHDHTWTAEVEELARPDLVVTLQRFADLLPFFGIETDDH